MTIAQDGEEHPRLYVGIGLGTYDHWDTLLRAVPDVEEVGEALKGFGYEVRTISNLDRRGLIDVDDDELREGVARNGALVLLWSGHAELGEQGLHLVVCDSRPDAAPSITAGLLASKAVRTGASQILLLLDTCFSGEGALTAVSVVDRVRTTLPPETERVWLGVVTSARAFEKAADGVFARRLVQVLREGPKDPELCLRWSVRSRGIWGEDLIAALLEGWDDPSQEPTAIRMGRDWVLFPNPRYDANAPERVVEHLLLAARGADPGDAGLYFTGRTAQLDTIMSWMQAGQRGVSVVTGPAGAGKSAIVGRVVSLSNPEERQKLLTSGVLGHADPGERSVHAHVHARRITVERVVDTIDEQLIHAGVIAPSAAGPRNRGELLGALERAATRPVIAIDGLDEAGADAWRIADEVVRPFAGYAQVLIGTRDLPAPDDSTKTLLQTLSPGLLLDLGAEEHLDATKAAVRAYVRKRLAGADAPSMDAEAVADAVVRIVPEENEGLFLLARVITQQLRAEPVDTSGQGWERQLSRSIEQAFDRDLARVPALRRGEADLPRAAGELLTALAWSYGAGLPDDVWPVVATALSPSQTEYGRDDLATLRRCRSGWR